MSHVGITHAGRKGVLGEAPSLLLSCLLALFPWEFLCDHALWELHIHCVFQA